jgi:hypothetical protein
MTVDPITFWLMVGIIVVLNATLYLMYRACKNMGQTIISAQQSADHYRCQSEAWQGEYERVSEVVHRFKAGLAAERPYEPKAKPKPVQAADLPPVQRARMRSQAAGLIK